MKAHVLGIDRPTIALSIIPCKDSPQADHWLRHETQFVSCIVRNNNANIERLIRLFFWPAERVGARVGGFCKNNIDC